MRWTKTVLLFQAVVTLILGLAFMSQVISLDLSKVSEYNVEINLENRAEGNPPEFVDIKQRYTSVAYILLFVSLIELVIITKLLT